jgi:RNA polymerase primary sigma factor
MLQFEQENEREPQAEEIAAMLEISTNDVNTLLNEGSRNHMSTDAPMGDGEDFTYGDLLQDSGAPAPDKSLIQESLQTEIKSVLSSLDSRDAGIVAYFFGLDGQPLSLDEIALKYDLTRERVRQIKENTIKKLRRNAFSRSLRTYLD